MQNSEENRDRLAIIDPNCEVNWGLLKDLETLEAFAMYGIFDYEGDNGIEYIPIIPMPAFHFYHTYNDSILYMFFMDPNTPRLKGDTGERKFIPGTTPLQSGPTIIPYDRKYLYSEFGGAISTSQLPNRFYLYRTGIEHGRSRESVDSKMSILQERHPHCTFIAYKSQDWEDCGCPIYDA